MTTRSASFHALARDVSEIQRLPFDAPLTQFEESTCSTLITGASIHPGLTASIDVPLLTMPQLLDRLGWSSVDLRKVDIEGAEESLFDGSSSWLAKLKAIVIEIHPNTTSERIQAHLAPYGFQLRRHGNGREPVYFADKTAA